MKQKKVGFVFARAPYGSSSTRELLDLVLVASAYEQDISLFFLGAGINQLRTKQGPSAILAKNHSKVYAGLDLYDIEKCFVRASDLEHYQLQASELMLPVNELSDDEFSAQLAAQDRVVTS